MDRSKNGTSLSSRLSFLSGLIALFACFLFAGCGGTSNGTVFLGSQPGGSGSTTTTTFTVTSASPATGPIAGGTQITVTGTNFPSNVNLTVTFGGVAATSLVVNSTSSITVTTPPHAAGVVDVVVTDPTGTSATLTNAFTYTSPAGPALQITTSSTLPPATLGVAYTQQIGTTGGSGGARTFSISAGALPTGLLLQPATGIISGAATQNGTATFTVTVTDSSGSASQQFTLTVSNILPGGQVALSDCNTILTSNTSYQLQNDISSPGTCLSVQGHDVVIDLNGHTITYFTQANNPPQPRFGILAIACFDVATLGNPCMTSNTVFSNITIAGNLANPTVRGKIIQGSGAAGTSFSHAIRIGQGQTVSGLTVHDVDITVSADSSFGIYSNFSKGGASIFNNVIHNNVTTIQNRKNFDGLSIKLDNEKNATVPNMIHDNTIIGGAQAGIRESNSAGSKIFNNDISMAATYTNDFCIDSLGDNIEIFNNNCHPTMGRGIHLAGNNVNVHDNTISVTERSMNQEYGQPIASIVRVANIVTVTTVNDINVVPGNVVVIAGTAGLDGTFTISNSSAPRVFTFNSAGPDLTLGLGGNASQCQIHGTYGIQVESDQVSSGIINIFNNHVTATATECDAQGLKLTTVVGSTQINAHDNDFHAVRVGNTKASAYGMAIDAVDLLGTTIFNNIFESDSALLSVDFDGGNNLKLTNNVIKIGANPEPIWNLVVFKNFSGGAAGINDVIQDPVYQNGASDANVGFHASAVPEEVFLNWSVILQITDASHGGAVVPGATVTIKDNTGTQVFTGTTDGNGKVTAVLTQRHIANSPALAIVPPDVLTPHSITVTKTGCTPSPDTFPLTVDPSLPAPGTPVVHALTTCP